MTNIIKITMSLVAATLFSGCNTEFLADDSNQSKAIDFTQNSDGSFEIIFTHDGNGYKELIFSTNQYGSRYSSSDIERILATDNFSSTNKISCEREAVSSSYVKYYCTKQTKGGLFGPDYSSSKNVGSVYVYNSDIFYLRVANGRYDVDTPAAILTTSGLRAY